MPQVWDQATTTTGVAWSTTADWSIQISHYANSLASATTGPIYRLPEPTTATYMLHTYPCVQDWQDLGYTVETVNLGMRRNHDTQQQVRHEDYRRRSLHDPARMEQEQRELAEAWDREMEERRTREHTANGAAEALLLSLLTPAQRTDYRDNSWIEGVSSNGNPFRIYTQRGTNGNVELLINGEWLVLCAHPEDVPLPDAVLAQKLALEADERAFMEVANLHGVAHRPAPVVAA
jgi:hypothetical protein